MGQDGYERYRGEYPEFIAIGGFASKRLAWQTVRRDNCRLVSSVIETCLHKMLIERDVHGAEK